MTDEVDHTDQAESSDQFWKLLNEHPDVTAENKA
jgi:hypothetical protein